MVKTTIVLKGKGGQGKSATIKLLRSLINSTYPSAVETILIDGADVKVLFEINGIKIGIESQGDPKSRQAKSIADFTALNCDIIICSSRTSGSTVRTVSNTQAHGYRIIWTTNYRSNHISHSTLNDLSAKYHLDLFGKVLLGTL